ncbi:RyR domain-containing protein [Paractinoplanes toevensis]|uniref:RCK N-terminal domain-containing protein n=1 Tax=Paractinoplanes toevensis TaxID=571911 RepID=A0A919T7A1_9ACTN|nr:RyR domain-containing protein [Actinoplanes toevensis]GIM90315.1 hypothetical protein Ato02nite_021080 [Actinoplanes toevensis]
MTEPGKMSWIARIFFALVAVGAVVCGMIGFHDYLHGKPLYGSGPLDLLYYSLQLFVLDASPLQNAVGLPLLLQIARFAAPIVTVYLIILATQALILGSLQQARINVMRGHSILCGPHELTRRLAEQIRDEKGKVVVISPEPAKPHVRGRALHMVGDPRRPAVLARAGLHRAKEVITVGLDNVRNAEVAIAVDAVNQAKGTRVVCYAEAQDRGLFEAVIRQEVGSDGGRVDVFSRHDRTAQGLLDHVPPADPGSPVLIIGYAGLGRMLVDRLMRYWSEAAGAADSLRVLDRALSETDLKARHPDPQGRITVTAADHDPAWLTTIDQLKVAAADGTMRVPERVYVCLDDDATAIAVGNVALRLLAGHESTVVVAVAHSSSLGAAAVRREVQTGTTIPAPSPVRELEKAKLVLVSVIRTVYAIAAIRTGTNETLARAIHDTYLERESKSPNPSPSAVAWEDLRPYLQDSNREQAWDIAPKLALIGYTVIPATGPITPPVISADHADMLAEVEHRRWMAERMAKGWSYGEHFDRARKVHPDLVGWADLPEPRRKIDRDFVLAIPDQLATAGLIMVRTR